MLNQKTFWENTRKHKNNSERLLLGPPKIRRIRKPKKPWENKKNKKNNSGEVLRKRGSSQESLRFFFGFPNFFWFFGFSDFGGSSQESPRIVFLVCLFSHGFWFFLVFSYVFFILYAYLSVFFGFDCGTDAFT